MQNTARGWARPLLIEVIQLTMNAIVCTQVVQPINGDPFIGMLEVRANPAALSSFLTSQLPFLESFC